MRRAGRALPTSLLGEWSVGPMQDRRSEEGRPDEWVCAAYPWEGGPRSGTPEGIPDMTMEGSPIGSLSAVRSVAECWGGRCKHNIP